MSDAQRVPSARAGGKWSVADSEGMVDGRYRVYVKLYGAGKIDKRCQSL